MKVAILQSNYLPWKGYFDIIHDVDLFIFYDDVQYTKNDWRNRNRIKTPKGSKWLTIPTGTDLNRSICDVRIPDGTWSASHWKLISENYKACPHFDSLAPFLHTIYMDRQWATLSELNHHLIRSIATDLLDIKTSFSDSRKFSLKGRGQDRVVELLKSVGATEYLSGPAGKAYLEPERFAAEGIKLTWKDYSGYPSYPQLFPPFDHNVSVIDLLLNIGAKAPWYIWGWRSSTSA
jgi:hypothetical protein